MTELPKAYTPSDVEGEIYERWLAADVFAPDGAGSTADPALPPFTIQYSTRALTSGDLTGTGCGAPGDTTTDGPWFDTVAAAGGAGQISAVRLVF